MITQLRNCIYSVIQTDVELLEGLLFLETSCGKYLKEDISAWHARTLLTLKHITFLDCILLVLPLWGAADTHFLRSIDFIWWVRLERNWWQDYGKRHRLPRVPVKIRKFLTKQLLLSSFRSSLWPWDEADCRPGDAGLCWAPPVSHHSAVALPKTRRIAPPPKKAETFRQGCASLTRSILFLCRSAQQRPDTPSVYLAWSAL